MTVDELFAKIDALDLGDPAQLRTAIGLLQVALETEDYFAETRNDLIVRKINYWLDLWEIEKNEEHLLSASNCIEEGIDEGQTSDGFKDSIKRLFQICVKNCQDPKYVNSLEIGIKSGFYLKNLEAKKGVFATSIQLNLAELLLYRYITKKVVKDFTRSINLSMEVLSFDNANSYCFNILGCAYFERYKITETIEYLEAADRFFKEALNLDPNNPHFNYNYAIVLEEYFKLSLDANYLEERIRLLSFAVEDEPENPNFLNNLANAYSDRFDFYGDKEDLKRWFKYIEKARKINPDSLLYLKNMGNAFEKRYEFKQDEDDLEELLKLRYKQYQKDPKNPGSIYSLALAFGWRYELHKQEGDLQKEIDLLEEASQLDSNNPYWMNNLALALGNRYKLLQNTEDLNREIELLEKALSLKPNSTDIMNNLALVLPDRYKLNQHEKDLQRQIELLEEALQLSPYNTNWMNNLGLALIKRYKLYQREEDLNRGINLFKDVLQLEPHDPDYMNNLAVAINKRYNLYQQEKDLKKSVELLEEALRLSPNNPDYMVNLADAVKYRYKRYRCVKDLDKRVELLEEVSCLRPHNTDTLNSLAISLRERYRLVGREEDCYKMIEVMEKALSLESDEPDFIYNLALFLVDRYQLCPTGEDLCVSIGLLEKALKLRPYNPTYMSVLGGVFVHRYRLYQQEEDLDRGIELLEEALRFDPNNPIFMNNLAQALEDRFQLHRKEEDLRLRIELLEEIIRLSPNNPVYKNSLGFALDQRYNLYQLDEDLDRQIKELEDALLLRPNSTMYLNHLLNVLEKRYDLHRHEKDLNRLVELREEALRLRPFDLGAMNNLALALADRYEMYKRREDLYRGIEVQKAAFKRQPEDPTTMFILGRLLIYRFEYNLNIEDYENGFKLINNSIQNLPKGHPAKAERYKFLGDLFASESKFHDALHAYEEMAEIYENMRDVEQRRQGRRRIDEKKANAFASLVSCCLLLKQPEKAMRYVEAAKSRVLVDVLHNQVVDLSKLGTDDEVIKDILARLQKNQSERNDLLKELEFGESDENRSERPVEEINADIEQKHTEENILWSQLEIHAPVFAMTISAPPFTLEEAQELAKQENATLISYYQTAEGWIAFVIDQESFICQRLVELDGGLMNRFLECYQKALNGVGRIFGKRFMSQVLEDAWNLLIAPLSDCLPEPGSNLIIAPFGELHLLPFVAFKDRKTGDCLIDRYQVKITTSLNTLKAMRAQADLPAEIQADKAMTVVAYPGAENPNEPAYLKGVDAEAEEILRLFQKPTVALTKTDATTKKTLENAARSEKLHFACHGMFNPKDPYRSGLKLKDAWLTVRDITTRMNLSGTDLVVMSSCLSGFSGVSKGEELTGLLTAFIASRARAVVGSLWSVDDKSTAKFMTEFYKNLQNGKPKAEALRDAQLYIRKQPQWSHPYYWAPFFITGVDLTSSTLN